MAHSLFDPLDYAKREISPLLGRLAEMTEASAPEQHAYFLQLHRHIDGAALPEDLLEAFVNLSTAAFLGFIYDPEVEAVLDHVLELAQDLSEALTVRPAERH